MREDLADIKVRPASAGDEDFVHELASEAFSAYSRDARRAIRTILHDRSGSPRWRIGHVGNVVPRWVTS
jgi:hypothetical protein